jgi:hypothetical protein
MSNSTVTEELKAWATPVQATYIDAILASKGSIRKAARHLGKHHSTLQEAIANVRIAAAAHGYSPEHNMNSPVPAPFVVKGQSTLSRVNPETGERSMILEWNKTRLDDIEWLEAIKSGVSAFVAEQAPITNPGKPLGQLDGDVIPWIQIGDAHLGMLAHEAETGANFDLKIAELELATAIDMLIDELPMVERLVIQDVGDFTHYENMAGVTEASGHPLDFDGRFPKMVDVYARLMRRIVDKALTKAHMVDVIINQGNHSRTNDIWMAVLIRSVYESTGRVNVLNNHTPFIGYRMGRTFVMCHHSDKCKPHRLASVMSTDFAADWGETDYRYIDIGHIHHNMVLKEHPGVVIESWNQLAAKDKWAMDSGYRSRQSISMVFRSRTYGEIGRRMLPLRQVQDRIRSTAHGSKHYIAPVQRAYSV